MDKKIIIATNNQKKLKELSAILKDLQIDAISMEQANIHLEIEETGKTFEENALLKAAAVCKASNFTAIADDSGLCVDALNGAPGIFSARYGGDTCKTDKDRNILLLESLRNVPYEQRGAKFVAAIAVVTPQGKSFTVRGECLGRILSEMEGEGGFGYDPLFYIEEEKTTFARMDEAIKNKISHRAKALVQLKEKIHDYI